MPEEASLRDLIATGKTTLASVDRAAKAVENAARSVDQTATLAQSSALRLSYLAGLRDGALAGSVLLSFVLVLLFVCRRACRA